MGMKPNHPCPCSPPPRPAEALVNLVAPGLVGTAELEAHSAAGRGLMRYSVPQSGDIWSQVYPIFAVVCG